MKKITFALALTLATLTALVAIEPAYACGGYIDDETLVGIFVRSHYARQAARGIRAVNIENMEVVLEGSTARAHVHVRSGTAERDDYFEMVFVEGEWWLSSLVTVPSRPSSAAVARR